jgi:DNA polymerase III gamma/tau subunit
MLKLLEDPPKNCWFILATTNPEKLKVTLKRRCTEFQVGPVSYDEVKQLMMRVARQNRKRIPSDLLNQIALDSMGSCGVALNILDKVIDLPPEDQAQAAKRFTEQSNTVINLCQAILKKDSWKKCCSILKSIEEEDPEGIRRKVLEYFRKVMMDGNESAYLVMYEFSIPYYDTGKAGLAMSVYQALSIR